MNKYKILGEVSPFKLQNAINKLSAEEGWEALSITQGSDGNWAALMVIRAKEEKEVEEKKKKKKIF